VLAPERGVRGRGDWAKGDRGEAVPECEACIGDSGESGSKMARDLPMWWFGCSALGDVVEAMAARRVSLTACGPPITLVGSFLRLLANQLPRAAPLENSMSSNLARRWLPRREFCVQKFLHEPERRSIGRRLEKMSRKFCVRRRPSLCAPR
jgi:hypothetical protein